jgi:hypothetical protein
VSPRLYQPPTPNHSNSKERIVEHYSQESSRERPIPDLEMIKKIEKKRRQKEQE